MDTRPIGVFDSGLGGLTAVKRLLELAPGENLVFFGDTARVPYGTRTPSTITRFALQDISFLLSREVKMVIAACGTVSSTLSEEMIETLPVPYLGVVGPTASAAVKATQNGKIGILGTPATIRSGSFSAAVAKLDSGIEVFAQACPLFVPLVENGYTSPDCKITRLAAQEYLNPLQRAGVDTVILGCTHYPIIAGILAEMMPGAVFIDSGTETARSALALLDEAELRNHSGGAHAFYTSDSPDAFTHLAELFLGQTLGGEVRQALLDQIPIHQSLEEIYGQQLSDND